MMDWTDEVRKLFWLSDLARSGKLRSLYVASMRKKVGVISQYLPED